MTNHPSAIEIIKIRSADEAWELLQRTLDGGELPENLQLVFDGWPSFDLRINGRDWHGTVPTRVMSPLLDVQKDIHRAYARIRYGSANLRKLSDEERDSLELVIQVEKGSSVLETPIWTQLNELATAAIGKMNSHDIVVTVLGLAVVYGGMEIAKAWIAQRQAAVESDNLVQLSEQETKRLEIFANAVQQKPALGDARSDYESTQNSILKTLKPGDKITAKGVVLQSDEAMEITQSERARSEDIDIRGAFRVVANDASKGAGFRVKVVRITDGLSFSADVPIELDIEQRKLIQKAEWSKGAVLVNLHISASILRDSIMNAVVYSAQEATTGPQNQ